jgi:glycosyltransferase involved in cell wall biosynthesis
VLLQGYPNLEYIIIDGGSTDNSVEIINKYAPWLTYWVSEADRGQSHALNKGFARATGELLGWLNSDDYYAPDGLALLVERYQAKPDAVAWVGACQELDGNDQPLRLVAPGATDRESLGDWGAPHHFYQPSSLFLRRVFEEVGGINEILYFAMDVDLWLRMREKGRFETTEQLISCARQHPEAKTYQDAAKQEAEFIAINYFNNMPEMAKRRLLRYVDARAASSSEIFKHFTYEELLNTLEFRPLIKLLMSYLFRRVKCGLTGRR